MKAVLLKAFGPPEVMRIGEVEVPVPETGQALVRVAATSVNRPDIVQRLGKYPPPAGESAILGLELAGTVASVGPGVESFAIGDRVFGLVGGGAYAEFAVAHAAHLLPIPDSMSFEQAACLSETYITAHMNLFAGARLKDGEAVLLHGGGGGVNTAAVQIVQALCPASRIYVTASPGKVERVAALGVHHVIDYRSRDFADAIMTESGGRGVDVILDHIGAAYLTRNLKALAVDGRLAIIATMGGREATLDLGRLLIRRQSIFGSVLRPRPAADKARIIAAFASALMPYFESGAIEPVIDRKYAIDDVVEAHRTMESSAHFGKIVLTLDGR